MRPARPSAHMAKRYRIAGDVAHREVEGQTLLLISSESGLLTLNATGQFVWRRLVRGRDVPAIVRAFRREFGVSAAVAERDVAAFVQGLESRKIIRRV